MIEKHSTQMLALRHGGAASNTPREGRLMEITEVRIKLMEGSEDRLRAFCSITIDDCFVIRDLKIIDGTTGSFVAMPSRKLTGHCNRCHHKNHLRANYCNHCGNKQSSGGDSHFDSPQKLYADVAHPINSACRELIQDRVIEEFQAELERSEQPGYRSRYDDGFDGEDSEASAPAANEPRRSSDSRKSDNPRRVEKPAATERSADVTADDSVDESELDHSVKVDPAGAVPQPQFMRDRPETSSSSPSEDEDGFGEGIF